MFDSIIKLKQLGYVPDTILDIGAYHGHWTDSMKQIYNNCNYYLFEAIDYDELKRFNNVFNINIFNVILSDKIDTVNWYQMKNTGDSMFREKTHFFNNCDIIKRETIDLNTFMLNNNTLNNINNSKNILIKIDCQGAEIPILKGASNILNKTDFIIMELPLFGQYNEGVGSFQDHILFMNSIGFIPYDIIDKHYINNFNMQVDMIFINITHPFNKMVGDNCQHNTI
jgi:FkbM family methyltransferase